MPFQKVEYSFPDEAEENFEIEIEPSSAETIDLSGKAKAEPKAKAAEPEVLVEDDDDEYEDDESDDDGSDGDDDYVTDSGDFSFSFDFDLDFDLDEDGSEVAASLTNSDQPVIDPCQNVNLVVDTYVIRRSVQQASSIGIDLLSALKLTFGATLYDFDKTTTQNDNVSATQWTTTSAADLTIPSITYALSIANDSSVYTSLEASPSVLLNLNEKSKIFEGAEIFIVSTSSQTSGQFEKEIGVNHPSVLR